MAYKRNISGIILYQFPEAFLVRRLAVILTFCVCTFSQIIFPEIQICWLPFLQLSWIMRTRTDTFRNGRQCGRNVGPWRLCSKTTILALSEILSCRKEMSSFQIYFTSTLRFFYFQSNLVLDDILGNKINKKCKKPV